MLAVSKSDKVCRRSAAEQAGAPGAPIDIVDATDWSIIPAENLVASCQAHAGSAPVLVYAATAADARTLLTALEVGVDGVVLRTDDLAEVRLPPAPSLMLAAADLCCAQRRLR